MVIHSGRGGQYRALIYQELLTEYHITHFNESTLPTVDNAIIESFYLYE
jgi:transposase InsO family protein